MLSHRGRPRLPTLEGVQRLQAEADTRQENEQKGGEVGKLSQLRMLWRMRQRETRGAQAHH